MHTAHDTDCNLAIAEWLRHSIKAVAGRAGQPPYAIVTTHASWPGAWVADREPAPKHRKREPSGDFRNRLWH